MMDTCLVSTGSLEAMRAEGGLAILQIYDGGRIAKPELIGEQCLRAPSAVASFASGSKDAKGDDGQ